MIETTLDVGRIGQRTSQGGQRRATSCRTPRGNARCFTFLRGRAFGSNGHDLTRRPRRRDVEGSLEASIAPLSYALEFMRSQDQADRDEKLLLHRPKTEPPASRLDQRLPMADVAQKVG